MDYPSARTNNLQQEVIEVSTKNSQVFFRTYDSPFGSNCSGQLIPDTALSFSSATAGASPSLN